MKDIIQFIKDQVKSANAKGVVLGISGGIDSAVVAVLAKKALGKVLLIYMPETYEINHDIVKLCKKFDMSFGVHTIEQELDSILKGFDEHLQPKLDIMTIGNIKARLRMLILYTYANEHNLLVIGTTNKSESMIGYFTKYGDGGVDFEPLAHLYKTEVIQLAKELGIPKEIIDKQPSAELWEGQTDEDEIGMSYKELDEILLFIEKKGYTSTSNNIKKNIDKVLSMIKKSEHKRNLPPMIK